MNTIQEWKTQTDYQEDDFVSYYGKIYKCLIKHTSNLAWKPNAIMKLWKPI